MPTKKRFRLTSKNKLVIFPLLPFTCSFRFGLLTLRYFEGGKCVLNKNQAALVRGVKTLEARLDDVCDGILHEKPWSTSSTLDPFPPVRHARKIQSIDTILSSNL